MGLTYTREYAQLAGYADASWEERNSTSGWVVLWQSAALSWGSHRQKSIALSTCEAEIIALSEATKDVVYLRKLVSGLGHDLGGPTSLSSDSQSARDVAYNPEHHSRMKHVLRRHFFVRDMVEEFEITVPFVRTADNLSDFLTKPFASAPAFFEARAIVMNERAAATRASAPSSGSTPHRGATAVRGGASEGDGGTAPMDKYKHAVREQPAREVRNV